MSNAGHRATQTAYVRFPRQCLQLVAGGELRTEAKVGPGILDHLASKESFDRVTRGVGRFAASPDARQHDLPVQPAQAAEAASGGTTQETTQKTTQKTRKTTQEGEDTTQERPSVARFGEGLGERLGDGLGDGLGEVEDRIRPPIHIRPRGWLQRPALPIGLAALPPEAS